MGHVFEPATTGRSKCRGCGLLIAAGELRFGEVVPNPFADGETTQWFHPECAAFKRPEPFLQRLQEDGASLPDRERLEAEARRGLEHPRVTRISGLERASSGRAQCRSCRETIAKDSWRIPLVFYEEGRFSPGGFVHVRCCRAYFGITEVMPRLRRFSPKVDEKDLSEVQSELDESPPRQAQDEAASAD